MVAGHVEGRARGLERPAAAAAVVGVAQAAAEAVAAEAFAEAAAAVDDAEGLAALLAAGSANANALNGDDMSSFDPAVAASRSLKRRTVSRVAPIANAGDTSGILVQEDIYASVEPASVGDDDGELVSAFAAATAESPCGPGWKLLWNDEFKFDTPEVRIISCACM